MKKIVLSFLYTFYLFAPQRLQAQTGETGKEKTAFQVADGWSADYDVRSDIAIVYGINDAGGNFEERVKSWRDKGYEVHFMTGIA